MKSYRPSILRLQKEWAARIARQRMIDRIRQNRPPRPASDIDLSNSEPWLENPQSVADFWFIAEQVNERVQKWEPRLTTSSAT